MNFEYFGSTVSLQIGHVIRRQRSGATCIVNHSDIKDMITRVRIIVGRYNLVQGLVA